MAKKIQVIRYLPQSRKSVAPNTEIFRGQSTARLTYSANHTSAGSRYLIIWGGNHGFRGLGGFRLKS